MLSLWQWLFRRGFESQRETIALGGGLDQLARSGVGTWLLAQEKARLDFLAAKEAYTQNGRRRSFDRVLDALQPQCTNAVVQALINENTLERLVLEPESGLSAAPSTEIGKSR